MILQELVAMKHQTIHKQLGISHKNYTKLRNKYRFFAYITDLLTLDYVLNLDDDLVNGLLKDLHEALLHKSVLRGLDMALFTSMTCFKPDNLAFIRSLTQAVNHYHSHKWQYCLGTFDVNI